MKPPRDSVVLFPDGCRDGDAAGMNCIGMEWTPMHWIPIHSQWIGMDTIRMDTNPLSAGGADAAADTVDEQDRMLPLGRRKGNPFPERVFRPAGGRGNGPEVPAYAQVFAAR